MSQSRPNLTGFDARKLAQAAKAGPTPNDPWARREAWRFTGPFTRYNRFRGALPGLGWGVGAFAVYMAYETVFMKDEHGEHAEHGESHGH